VIPLGIRDLPQPIREQPERLILAVGRLVPYKGFDVLVSAAALLPSGARVVIAGDGPLRAALQRQIDELGVADRVQLAGRVSEPQLARLYASAAAFCLPSVERSEAFGVVLLEAMRAGLPIVATDLPGSGVPWVNEHGLTGFNVTVGDSSALADALTRLLEDEANRRRMGAAARQRFEAMFIAESTAVAWLELYSELFSALD
jgi:glycosyltransferase involved in cell wall biosynthesis